MMIDGLGFASFLLFLPMLQTLSIVLSFNSVSFCSSILKLYCLCGSFYFPLYHAAGGSSFMGIVLVFPV